MNLPFLKVHSIKFISFSLIDIYIMGQSGIESGKIIKVTNWSHGILSTLVY